MEAGRPLDATLPQRYRLSRALGGFVIGAALLILLLVSPSDGERPMLLRKPTGVEETMIHQGVERVYRLHVPREVARSGTPRPLVFVFHGGGMGAGRISTLGFTKLADREQFIVVYPQASDRHWNDGREGKLIVEKAGHSDDVGFVMALLENLKKRYPVDETRVFATGFSNGGMMSHRLAIEQSSVFAAVAPGIGGIPKPLGGAAKFQPTHPVSMFILQGTDDPFVPYQGGRITPELVKREGPFARKRDHGEIIATDRTIELWKKQNAILGKPTVTRLPDRDKGDGCRLERYQWPAGREGSKLVLVKMVGAGHTVPGAAQYLPERVIGKTCRDAEAVEMIWEFFQSVPAKKQNDQNGAAAPARGE